MSWFSDVFDNATREVSNFVKKAADNANVTALTQGKFGFGMAGLSPKIDIPTLGDIQQGVQGLGKNLERNLQNTSKGIGLIAQGKWNNAGRTIFDMNPYTWFMNPDDKDALGEAAFGESGKTAVGRYTQDAKDQQAYAEAADLQAQRDEIYRQATSTVAGLISARRRGGDYSFFGPGGSSDGNTLLTFLG